MEKQPTNADLRRKILRLERLLAAEREASERAWSGYRKALHDAVDARMKLEEIRAALERTD